MHPQDLDLRLAVDRLLPSLTDQLKRLVAIPSVSGANAEPKPLFAACDVVTNLLSDAGIEDVEHLEIEGKVAPVIIAKIPPPEGQPTDLFYTHYDVVPPGDESLWESPPFEAVERDGELYGRGTADSKANLVGTIGALRVFNGELPVGVTLVFEGQEEVGSQFDFYPPQAPEHF